MILVLCTLSDEVLHLYQVRENTFASLRSMEQTFMTMSPKRRWESDDRGGGGGIIMPFIRFLCIWYCT